jgi:hypothetical protein
MDLLNRVNPGCLTSNKFNGIFVWIGGKTLITLVIRLCQYFINRFVKTSATHWFRNVVLAQIRNQLGNQRMPKSLTNGDSERSAVVLFALSSNLMIKDIYIIHRRLIRYLKIDFKLKNLIILNRIKIFYFQLKIINHL